MSAMPLSAAIGRRLQELRIGAGVSLPRLAKKAGLTTVALRGMEEGRTQPSVATLDRVAKELAVSLPGLVAEAKQVKIAPAVSPQQIAHAILGLQDSGDKLELVEAATVRHVLQVCGGNKSGAARVLGMDRKALERRAGKFGAR